MHMPQLVKPQWRTNMAGHGPQFGPQFAPKHPVMMDCLQHYGYPLPTSRPLDQTGRAGDTQPRGQCKQSWLTLFTAEERSMQWQCAADEAQADPHRTVVSCNKSLHWTAYDQPTSSLLKHNQGATASTTINRAVRHAAAATLSGGGHGCPECG